jgi:hypothetical protein
MDLSSLLAAHPSPETVGQPYHAGCTLKPIKGTELMATRAPTKLSGSRNFFYGTCTTLSIGRNMTGLECAGSLSQEPKAKSPALCRA